MIGMMMIIIIIILVLLAFIIIKLQEDIRKLCFPQSDWCDITQRAVLVLVISFAGCNWHPAADAGAVQLSRSAEEVPYPLKTKVSPENRWLGRWNFRLKWFLLSGGLFIFGGGTKNILHQGTTTMLLENCFQVKSCLRGIPLTIVGWRCFLPGQTTCVLFGGNQLPPWNSQSPWHLMVARLLSFYDDTIFLVAMLVSVLICCVPPSFSIWVDPKDRWCQVSYDVWRVHEHRLSAGREFHISRWRSVVKDWKMMNP